MGWETFNSERPQNGRRRHGEAIAVGVSTDSNGAGSKTVNFDSEHNAARGLTLQYGKDFFGDVKIEVTDAASTWQTEITVSVQNAPTSTTVTVWVERRAEQTR